MTALSSSSASPKYDHGSEIQVNEREKSTGSSFSANSQSEKAGMKPEEDPVPVICIRSIVEQSRQRAADHQKDFKKGLFIPKSILILSLSIISPYNSMRQCLYVPEGIDSAEAVKKKFFYYYQLEPVVRWFNDRHIPFDEIIVLCTEETSTPENAKEILNDPTAPLTIQDGTNRAIQIVRFDESRPYVTAEEYFRYFIETLYAGSSAVPIIKAFPDYMEEGNRSSSSTIKTISDVLTELRNCKEKTDSFGNELTIYVDVHGGLRPSQMILDNILSLLRLEDIHVNPSNVYNVQFANNTGHIQNVGDVLRISNFVSGINEFNNFGSTRELLRFYDIPMHQDPITQSILDDMTTISDGISLSDINRFEHGIRELSFDFGNLNTTDTAGESGSNYLRMFASLIETNYHDLLMMDPADPNVLTEVKWSLQKNLLQQALTFIEDKMPRYLLAHDHILEISFPDLDEDAERQLLRSIRSQNYVTDRDTVLFYTVATDAASEVQNKYRNDFIRAVVDSYIKKKNENQKIRQMFEKQIQGVLSNNKSERDNAVMFIKSIPMNTYKKLARALFKIHPFRNKKRQEGGEYISISNIDKYRSGNLRMPDSEIIAINHALFETGSSEYYSSEEKNIFWSKRDNDDLIRQYVRIYQHAAKREQEKVWTIFLNEMCNELVDIVLNPDKKTPELYCELLLPSENTFREEILSCTVTSAAEVPSWTVSIKDIKSKAEGIRQDLESGRFNSTAEFATAYVQFRNLVDLIEKDSSKHAFIETSSSDSFSDLSARSLYKNRSCYSELNLPKCPLVSDSGEFLDNVSGIFIAGGTWNNTIHFPNKNKSKARTTDVRTIISSSIDPDYLNRIISLHYALKKERNNTNHANESGYRLSANVVKKAIGIYIQLIEEAPSHLRRTDKSNPGEKVFKKSESLSG